VLSLIAREKDIALDRVSKNERTLMLYGQTKRYDGEGVPPRPDTGSYP
jgi:hypothetical protein